MEYLPLQMIKNTTDYISRTSGKEYQYGTAFQLETGILKELTADLGIKIHGIPDTEKEYVRAMLSNDFLSEDKNALYPEFNKTCLKIMPMLMNASGLTIEYFEKNKNLNIRTELRDIMLQFILFDRWAMNKQVLKPEKTFAYHLIQTEKLRISRNILEHLPFNCFYIDISDANENNIFGDIKGIFVNVVKITDTEFALALYNVDKSVMTFSHYSTLYFEDSDEIEIDTSTFTDIESIDIAPLSRQMGNSKDKSSLMAKNLRVFVLQMLCYISIPNADINENYQMKSTYHPNKTVKNKFREVYIQDVGIKIGSVITQRKKQAEEEYRNSAEYASDISKNRKPPVAHFRRAHWHRYWTGHGRTELVTNWIEPVFVCGKSANITIHPVKN